MARYNKIYAGPFTDATPQVREALAVAETLPGCLVVESSGKFALAGAETDGKVWLAQDNYLALKGTDEAWDADKTMIGMEILPGQLFNVRVANGADIKVGDALTTAANGLLAKQSTIREAVVAFADETYKNETGGTDLIRVRCATGYLTLPAPL